MISDWPHAPVHKLTEKGAYMVTCGTYKKKNYLDDPNRLDFFQETLFTLAEEFNWQLQAWAILSNHYHFVAISPDNPVTLKSYLSKLHSVTARRLNECDDSSGRRVWYQYYDTHITYEKSYFARLNYVHKNPVHHNVAKMAANYKWCSAFWFTQHSNSTFRKTVESFKIDTVNVYDDY